MHAPESLVKLSLKAVLALIACAAAASAQPYGYVSNTMGNTVSVVNIANNTVAASILISAAGLAGLAITPDGSYLYVAEQSKNSVGVISTSSKTVVNTILVGTSPVQVAITPNGATAYVANQGSNNVSVINTATRTVVANVPVGTKPVGIAVTRDGSKVLVANLSSANISVISTASNTVVATWTALAGPNGMAMSPNGSLVYVTNKDANAVTVYNLSYGTIQSTITGFAAPNAAAVTPDGSQLYVTNANSSKVFAVNTSSFAITQVPVGLLPTSVAVSSDGTTAYVTNAYGYSLSEINTANNTVKYTLKSVGIYPYSVALFIARIQDTGTSVPEFTTVSAASYTPAIGVAPDSIVAGFGKNLAETQEGAAALPLPTVLAGRSVSVRDSAGAERPAPLFMVSPTQVNYLISPDTAVGLATVTVMDGQEVVTSGPVQVNAIAPALFSVNASGQGVAAAQAVQVSADGTQTTMPVAQWDAVAQRWASVPIDLSAGVQTVLLLYGTGIRGRSSPDAVQAQVGGVHAIVDYAGAQPAYSGLDQVNLRLPQELAGRGEVVITLTVDSVAANQVTVNVK
jgi:uncharacterized protein (TIGR03437 family)